MTEQKGYYREAVDIKFIRSGTKVRLADDSIVTTPRTGMYKMTMGLLLVEVMEEPAEAAFTEKEAKALLTKDPRGDTIIQGPWGNKEKPNDSE